jgi:FkbM family methyltransferase
MNLSGIPSESVLGRLLRAPLRWIPRDARVPILQGRLRGTWWIVGSSTHGCWLGSYEHEKRRAFESEIFAGGTVFDVGAHVGFYTLLASKLAGPEGRVVAFEPVPRNLLFLREHLRLNRVKNVEVVEAAASSRSGSVSFDLGPTHTMGAVTGSGGLVVRSVALDDFVESGTAPAPDVIKMDIEGEELRALEGARRLLERSRPTVFLATHGAEVHEGCCRLLAGLGYDLATLDGRRLEESEEVVARSRAR